MKKEEIAKPRRWIWIIVFLLVLVLFASIMTSCIALFSQGSIESLPSGNVALIKIEGVITSTGDSGFFGEPVASADVINEFIDKADKNKEIKAIIFEINSPGGSAVASEEIASRINRLNKTTVSYIREVGASGGYWIASETDRIFASRMSITGSVGVIASYLEFSGLLNRYNVTYQRLVAGEHKDIGTPLRKLTPIEEELLQEQLDQIHGFFLDEVKQNRKLNDKQVKEIETGIFFIGAKAKELNLIDDFGGKDEAIAYVEQQIKEKAVIAEYKSEPTLLELLGSLMNKNSFYLGQGIGSAFLKNPSPSDVKVYT